MPDPIYLDHFTLFCRRPVLPKRDQRGFFCPFPVSLLRQVNTLLIMTKRLLIFTLNPVLALNPSQSPGTVHHSPYLVRPHPPQRREGLTKTSLKDIMIVLKGYRGY